jgi:hypothetical protein
VHWTLGFCGIFKHFSGFEFSLLPNRIRARPSASNASRSATLADLEESEEVPVRGLLASLLLLLALASCMGHTVPVTATLGETALAHTPTPTPAPYWELLPMTSQPEGGWKIYQSDDLDFTFQYPAMYDKDRCRRIWSEDKYWRDPPQTVFGLGPINIIVIETWSGNLAAEASFVASMSESQVLSAVESFSIDGVPAFRLIYRPREGLYVDYVKTAFVAFAGKLYQFSYAHLTHVTDCDALPFSEETVYDHLLSTVEFKH